MNLNRTASVRQRRIWIVGALVALALACIVTTPGSAQTWVGTSNNNWFTGANWTGGTSPNSTGAVVSILTPLNNPVELSQGAAVSTLTMGSFNVLSVNAGATLAVYGGSIVNAGILELNAPTTNNAYLQLFNDTTLSGAGQLTLNGGQIGTDGNGRTLTNQSTINGYGTIGSNAGPDYQNLSLNNSGTVNANIGGDTLSIQGTGGSITNSGLMEATAGGTLNLQPSAPIANSGGNITASGAGSIVNVNATIEGGTLNTSGGGLMQTNGTATLNGSNLGAITISNGSTYTAGGTSGTYINGTLDLAGSTSNLALSGYLVLNGDTTVSGPGTVTMAGGQIGTDGNGRTLTNNSIIQGSGVIGSNASYDYQNLSLANAGTIDANSAGNTLSIQGTGGFITNTGLLEATKSGILTLASQAPVVNTGANITANGGTVNVATTIQGGTLNTLNGGIMQTDGTATLDATTAGAITLSNGSTYTAGAGSETLIAGTLNLGTSSTGSTFALGGQLRLVGDTTFSGPGVVVMTSTNGSTGQIGTDGNGRNLFNKSTIEGSGLIGSNASDVYPNLSLYNSGTINANQSGNTLTIGGNGGVISNTGLFEATNGGTLTLASSAPVQNQGANITAKGGTVNVSTSIQGGTLNTLNGGTMQTVGSATLDGTTHGAITLSNGSTYGAAAGTLTYIAGTLNVGTGSKFNLGGQLRLVNDTTLAGTGTLVMSSTDGNTGQIGTDGNGRNLYNQITIEGSGLIGSNASNVYPNLSLNNSGTVNANVSGQTLGIGGNGSTINTGKFEATNGGILDLFTSNPVDNNGGTILASGAGSTVNVNTSIQGGSLTTTGGGLMQTGTSGATLDGTTNGAITITNGSTYTAGANGLTKAAGTLNLGTSTGGTLALTAGGQLQLVNDLTLTGPGSLTMSSSGGNMAQIGTDGNGRTLTNQSTIQGGGLIGSNVGALYQNLNVNNASNGTILANQSGQTLQIGGTGSTTNSGTFQANAGSTLEVSNALTNYSGGTLTGGTYYANGGTIQLNVGGTTGGEITTDAGHITLSGASAAVNDLGNHNALADLSTVAANSSLTLITGQQFATAASTFTNSGTVTVGANSSKLTVSSGSFVQGTSGTFVEVIGGSSSGQFGLTTISGNDTLAGTLDVDLVNGFTLAANQDDAITFMYSGDAIGKFSNVVCPTNDTCTVVYNGPAKGDVTLDIDGPVQQGGTPPVPEPATFGMLFSGLASLAAGLKMRRSRTAA